MTAPNTRKRTVSNNMEELLREISEKLSILIEKIDSNHDPINHALENINQHFETIYEKRRDFIDFGTDFATNNMQLEKEISMKLAKCIEKKSQ